MEAGIEVLDTGRYYPLACFLEEQVQKSINKETWLEYFKLFWDENEAFKNNNFARGWMLLTENREIKGFFGNIPVYYSVGQEERTFCSGTTWYVDKSYRSKSLLLLRDFLKQPCALLDTTPNMEAEIIFKRCGFSSFAPQWILKDYIFPGNGVFFILSILKKIYGFKDECPAYSCERIGRFNDDYDVWWKKIKEKYHTLALRDARRLNWFYFGSSSLKESRIVLEVRKNRNLSGYAGFKVMDRGTFRKKTCFFEMIDLLLLEEDEDVYNCVLRKILILAKGYKKKVAGIRVNSFNRSMESCLKKSGFFASKGRSKFLYRDLNHQIDEENFYTTALDGDRCFFP